MKYLLLVLAVIVLLWLIKGALGHRAPKVPPADDARDGPRPMVRCLECGLHLPSADALPGRGGVFCGDTHRAEYERKHPPA